MNCGIVFGSDKYFCINDRGGFYEAEQFAKHDINKFLNNLKLDRFSINQRCIIVFCEGASFDLKKTLLNKSQTFLGQVNFFVADIYKVAFSGCYSIPKHCQVCLSLGNKYAQLFLFEKGKVYRQLCIRLKTSHSLMTDKKKFMATDRSLVEMERYVFELGSDQIANSLAGEILKQVKTIDKNALDQGIVGFVHNPDAYTDLLMRVEKLIKLPIFPVNTDYLAVKKYMLEVVKDKNIFEYVIKQS